MVSQDDGVQFLVGPLGVYVAHCHTVANELTAPLRTVLLGLFDRVCATLIWPYRSGASQVVLVVKNLPANAGDIRDSRSGRSLGGGHGNPLQHSCLENPMNRGAWWATVHGCNESDTTEQLGTAVVTYLYICVFPLDRELLKGSSWIYRSISVFCTWTQMNKCLTVTMRTR